MTSATAVHVEEVSPGVVQVTMQDRAHKNTFSAELVAGLLDAFQAISANTAFRAVVLTGYDTYFCTGGTQESLLMLQEGRGKFSDTSLYGLPLDCPIPVVSAMQGHAIGGGFVFGLFADCVVLSRESVYTTNFMKYGFTPGMGATCILPRKLGMGLAHEMMLTARTYRGADLEKRGIAFPVVPRAQVLEHARSIARDLAEKPRTSLMVLKDHLVADIRTALPAIIRQEVAMHEQTFHQPEVRERIQSVFGD